jgi:predicted secreted protein
LLLAAAGLVAHVSMAQEPALPAQQFDVVSFQAQASREVENDELAAVLAVEAHGPDAAALAETVNRRMAEALKMAAGFPAVRVRSGNYQTLPRYREQRIDGWQVSQELRLESADFAAATRLIGRLQQTMQVRSMAVRLSPAARRAAEDALIAEAIAAFRARAALVQAAMKASGYRIRTLDIGTGGEPPPQPFGVARQQAAAVAVEAGVSHVNVTASGSIQLH